ncbi:MAG: tripartite tricarboxylate transporter substrate binding protein [Spirochaetae bacterium HGW-Spirochaetae-3]|jgi:tripartite-type tricarboxylate transporter receptor subunit TctC|nr:MAG: tripartite tricarboxylate transporter substrate binding protein [Spirochaetae bacterium HGW-Spirochaetae-3]
MKKIAIVAMLLTTLCIGLYAEGTKEAVAFPSKPIRVIVYAAAGGQLDITARKFAEIAAKYTPATFVVENKPGAGGLVGWEYVLSQPEDGYTLMAVTKTLIANHVKDEFDVDPMSLNWTAFLINDAETIITNANSKIRTIADIVADAKARPGQQIWVAPPGVDEVVTYKFWDRNGISGKYVPYDAGGQAMAAVIGQQAQVYVGNPVDVRGKPDLMMAAISAEKRFTQFPDVPTFKELGIKGLDAESFWRGFALKKGTPASIIAWYDELFTRITADPEWRQFNEKDGMEVVHYKSEKFNAIVADEVKDFKTYFKK